MNVPNLALPPVPASTVPAVVIVPMVSPGIPSTFGSHRLPKACLP